MSSADGVKALYAVNRKKIVTYIFDKKAKDWSRGDAEKWVRSHEKDTKKAVTSWMEANGGQEMDALIKFDNTPTPLMIFAPIVKVDKEKRMVWGYATTEAVDKQGEIIDWEASKAAFGDWPRNVREMHQPKAVGKAIEVIPDEDKKGFYVGTYVSKGAEDTWQKVLDGTLAGYSIGGQAQQKVVEQRRDVEKGTSETVTRVKKYKMSELSLVDNPANPECDFKLVKSDGSFTDTVGVQEPAAEPAKDFMKEYGALPIKHDLPSLEKVLKDVLVSILNSGSDDKTARVQQTITDFRKCFVGPSAAVCGHSVSKTLTEVLADYVTMSKSLRQPEKVFSEGYDQDVWKTSLAKALTEGEVSMEDIFMLKKEMEDPSFRDNIPDSEFAFVKSFEDEDQPKKIRKFLMKSKAHARAALATLEKDSNSLSYLERYEVLKRINKMGIEAGESVLKAKGSSDLSNRPIDAWSEWAGSFKGCLDSLVAKGDVENPEALCAWLCHNAENKWPAEDTKKFEAGDSCLRLTVDIMKEICPSCAESMVSKGISAYKIYKGDIDKLAPIVAEIMEKRIQKGGTSVMEIEKQLDLSALKGKTLSISADMLTKDEKGVITLTEAAIAELTKQYGKAKDPASSSTEMTDEDKKKAAAAEDLKKAGTKASPDNPNAKKGEGDPSGAHDPQDPKGPGAPLTGTKDAKKKGPGDPEATYKMVCPKCEHGWLVKYKVPEDIEKAGSLTDDSGSVTYARQGSISDVTTSTDKGMKPEDLAKAIGALPVFKELSDALAKTTQQLEGAMKKNEELEKKVDGFLGQPAPRKDNKTEKVTRTFGADGTAIEKSAPAQDEEMVKFEAEKQEVIEKIAILRKEGKPIPADLQAQADKLVSKSLGMKFQK